MMIRCLVWLIGIGLASAWADRPEIVVFDLAEEAAKLDTSDPSGLKRHYDVVLLTSCLQGLVNRREPQLFVRYNPAPDDFWFARATEPGGWLENRKVVRVTRVQELLKRFGGIAKGLVIWDEQVPATSNVAATIAGVEDLLAVRFDPSNGSLYHELVAGPDAWRVSQRLLKEDGQSLFTGSGMIPGTQRKSSGSAKNDAYLWLLEHYIQPRKTNDRMLGYYIDGFWLKCVRGKGPANHTLNNLDYLIAHRAAIVDLNVWEDEAPVDDPKQAPGTDLATFREILGTMVEANRQQSMIAVYGFPPWAFKYSNSVVNGWRAGSRHEAVATEWKFAVVITAHNGYMDADALGYSSFPNASFYQNYRLPPVIKQDAVPSRERLIREGVLDAGGRLLPINYYAHYQGDFDAAAWVYWHFPKILGDPARGTLPLTWAINPSLASRFPFGMHYIRQHRAPGEVFIAGEAAGYLNPSLLQAPRPAPGLADALDLWVKHNQKWYRQWDLHVTGFNIDGNTPMMSQRGFSAYQKFSPGGLGLQRAPAAFGVCQNLAFAQMMVDLPGSEGNGDLDQTAEMLRGFFEPDGPNFVLVRSILQTPTYYAEIQRRLLAPGNFPNKLVDMPTLFWLIREYHENPIYAAARPQYGDKPAVSASPLASAGIRIRRIADGVATHASLGDTPVWQTAGGAVRFLYADVADDFAKSAIGKGVLVRVRYIDVAAGWLGIDYDSNDARAPLDGAYKPAKPMKTVGNGEMAMAEFELADAVLSGRQNGRSDFRLEAGGKRMCIASIEVIKR